MIRRVTLLTLLVATGLLVRPALAQVTVHLVDGRSTSGHTITLAKGRLTLATGGDAPPRTWPIDDVARIEFLWPEPPATDPPAEDSKKPKEDSGKPKGNDSGQAARQAGLVLVVGGAIGGLVAEFDGQEFTVTGTDFGDIRLPLAAVTAVQLTENFSGRLSPGESRTDLLVLANGDRLAGTVNRIDAEKVQFHSETLGDRTLDRERVPAIRIAVPAKGRPKPKLPALKVITGEGTAVELCDMTIADGMAGGAVAGGPILSVPLKRLKRIDVIGGRLIPLETLEPSVYEQHSLDILKWEIRRGQNVLGKPMRLRVIGGAPARTFESGLGVHGPCRVVYKLGGAYARFMATAGIDESAGQWADVNLVVKVDGKEVFRTDHVKWREPARRVNVPVAGAKTLELIVEAGEHYDVQDRVNWAQARLLRAKVSPKKSKKVKE
ncbi:MAG: hypothetical protein GWP05_10695 [Anaerolineaceae bacterium]|nr:hypothetical protein [Anaerolineaceae bacterium]